MFLSRTRKVGWSQEPGSSWKGARAPWRNSRGLVSRIARLYNADGDTQANVAPEILRVKGLSLASWAHRLWMLADLIPKAEVGTFGEAFTANEQLQGEKIIRKLILE